MTMPSRMCVIQDNQYYTIRKSLYEALQDILYIQLLSVVNFGIEEYFIACQGLSRLVAILYYYFIPSP